MARKSLTLFSTAGPVADVNYLLLHSTINLRSVIPEALQC